MKSPESIAAGSTFFRMITISAPLLAVVLISIRVSLAPEAMARMEKELARLQESMAEVQENYGKDHLQLTVVKGYLGKLLGNPRVVRYLLQHRPEYLEHFQAIADAASFADQAA